MTSCFIQYGSRGERKVATALVTAALNLGLMVSVHDGDGWVVKRSTYKPEVLDALATADHDEIILRDKDGAKLGWFQLIWGNEDDGSCLIADYLDNEFCHGLLQSIGYY